jgi:hypothetical protein
MVARLDRLGVGGGDERDQELELGAGVGVVEEHVHGGGGHGLAPEGRVRVDADLGHAVAHGGIGPERREAGPRDDHVVFFYNEEGEDLVRLF